VTVNDLRINDLFDLDPMESSIRSLLRPWRMEMAERAPQIRLDVSEADGKYLVKADIPGVRKDDIDVRIDGKQVTISAEVKQEKEEKSGERVLRSERQFGFASRSFTLADSVDEARAEAKFENGVLKLTLPKRAPASQKRLAVQ
jgi:HSP20 family protein